jgi:hypothetical protein
MNDVDVHVYTAQVEIMHAVEDIVKIIKAYHLDDHLERVQEEVSIAHCLRQY